MYHNPEEDLFLLKRLLSVSIFSGALDCLSSVGSGSVTISVISVSVIVAEVTQPFLGVGYELGRAVALNKRFFCLRLSDSVWFSVSVSVIVAEVTQPSFAVGYELGQAVALNKRVFCLFRPSSGKGIETLPHQM